MFNIAVRAVYVRVHWRGGDRGPGYHERAVKAQVTMEGVVGTQQASNGHCFEFKFDKEGDDEGINEHVIKNFGDLSGKHA